MTTLRRAAPEGIHRSLRAGESFVSSRRAAARQGVVLPLPSLDTVHRRLDLAFVRMVRRFGLLYQDGFGTAFDERVEAVRRYRGGSRPVAIDWGPVRHTLGAPVRVGRFPSPAAAYLPQESQHVVFEQWLPSAGMRASTPVCLVLASTGEEGALRRRPLARFLSAHGISAIIVENPFYGVRRPRGQRGPALRTAADQFAMNLATVEEALALLYTFHELGHDVGTTGYSQGGAISAFAAAFCEFPLATIPRAAPVQAAPIFTVHALSHSVHWHGLARDAGSLEAARARLCAALQEARIDRHPPPRAPQRAIVVAHRSDGFIPLGDALVLHRHWRGSELRFIDGGHVSGLALHHREHWQAVLDAFAR